MLLKLANCEKVNMEIRISCMLCVLQISTSASRTIPVTRTVLTQLVHLCVAVLQDGGLWVRQHVQVSQ